ncbi:MAG TPA: hypothetical protein VFC81_02605 [Verrucomicrobiae bacterium]|nr:hypothetical protein [Verrucomicrobiae bacterium]
MIEMDAYAADCRLFGLVDLGEARLTDILNGTSELRLREARLESLADGHVMEAPELIVSRDELCAVVASGSRGDAARRLRTHATRVVVDLGPYHIVGAVHGTPASDPLGAVLRRAAWVPLTEATVTYRRGLDPVSDEVETLLVNRALASLFRAAAKETSAVLPWETPGTARPAEPRALDLTGSSRDEERPDHDEEARPPAGSTL